MTIVTKQEALNELESKRNEWMDDGTYSVHSIDAVTLKENSVCVDGLRLNEKAVSKMLYRMQLTDKFIDYKNQVDDRDFVSVFDNIIKWNKGRQIVTKTNGQMVSDVFFYQGQEDFNSSKRLSMIIDGVSERISSMQDDIEIHQFGVDTNVKNIRFSTVDPSTKFNAIGSDEWVLGSILSIGLTEGFASPYYGRLICTNGMVDGIKMRKASLMGKGYTEGAISQLISKGTNLKKLASDHIREIASSAVSCEVSLSEYLSFRKIMSEGLHEEQKQLADSLFPLHHIESAYGGKEVFENNEQWKRTAKSGTTVYELLNDITKWTTHDKNVSNGVMKNKLNEKASLWFMKGEWHNRNVAPNVEIKRGPIFNDSVAIF